jgi:hopene-associated glycosyltransferase HpnB
MLTGIGILSLAIWLYLIALHGGYWRASERLQATYPDPSAWPAVVAIVPARNEAEVIGPAMTSLLTQDYPGRLDIVLVDDHSTDGTAAAATKAAAKAGRADALSVVPARSLPAGWSGKLWALAEGARHLTMRDENPDFLWLSDADIAHEPNNLRRLVGKAVAERRDMVSLMVALSCRGAWERLLIPPFVYFFQMLYPFAWVNDPRLHIAAAAGGCVLVRRITLERAGGFAAIKGALIDDCSLARLIKHGPPPGGRIWIGLATAARSIRPYQGLGEIWRMVARSAYTQLRHSPILLAGTLIALTVTFLAPPALVLSAPVHGNVPAALAGLAAWALMSVSVWPTFEHYRQPGWRALLLPIAAAFYGAMTFDSALRHWRGRGGAWKGRVHPAKVDARRPKL